MGMYTGLRGKVLLKNTNLTGELIEKDFYWDAIREDVKTKVINSWLAVGRHGHIPWAALCYMPDSWGDDTFSNVEDFSWTFCCSLKNYEQEIEFFIESVLPEIADAWALESFYEESAYSQLHLNGEPVFKQFNTYKSYDPYYNYERDIDQLPFVDVFKMI